MFAPAHGQEPAPHVIIRTMRSRAMTWLPQGPLLAVCVVAALLTPPTRSPDEQLRRRLLAQLQSDPATEHLPLAIAISSGVATVSGGIDGRSQQAQVLAIVGRTPGVMDVINDLTISDRIIAQKVRDAFRADPSLAPIPVTVTSVDGEVTLESRQTNDAQRRRLVQIASNVDGVVHVVDAMK